MSSPTERDPLLVPSRNNRTNGHNDDQEIIATQANDSDTPLAEEPGSKHLLMVLAPTWVGVFFAALGTALSQMPHLLSLIRSSFRYDHYGHPRRPNRLRFPIPRLALLAGYGLSNRQRCLSTARRPIDGHFLPTLGTGFLKCLLRSWLFGLWVREE